MTKRTQTQPDALGHDLDCATTHPGEFRLELVLAGPAEVLEGVSCLGNGFHFHAPPDIEGLDSAVPSRSHSTLRQADSVLGTGVRIPTGAPSKEFGQLSEPMTAARCTDFLFA
jgi:hypothetical protein